MLSVRIVHPLRAAGSAASCMIPTSTKSLKLVAAGLVMLALFRALPAFATTIIVNTELDETISGDGLCSLREAINNANGKTDTTGGDCNSGTGNDTIAILLLGKEIDLGSSLP